MSPSSVPGLTSIAETANWLLVLTVIPASAALGGLLGAAIGVVGVSCGSLIVLVALLLRAGVMPELRLRTRALERAEAAA